MSKMIHLGKGLDLPLSAVTQTFAFMGKRGAGKTYGAGKLVEEMLAHQAQVVVIDPVGNWWGLRLDADGKKAGLSIPVIGGAHGDMALAPEAGTLIADVVVDTGSAMVLDVSQFRKSERQRFVADFAEQLFHRKKSARTPLHVVFEEAHLVVPQRIHKGQERMLGAMEDLVKLGRNYGIGASLLDQRPQSVNKDVLNQTECLLAFQLIGSQERKAIDLWAEDKGIAKGATRRLSELAVGQAFVWSPTWLRFFNIVTINRKRTFDASATPEVGGADQPSGKLATIDLAGLELAMTMLMETKAAKRTPPKPRPEPVVRAAPVAVPTVQDFRFVARAVARLRELADQLEREAAAVVRSAATTGQPETAPPVGKGPRAMLQALASLHPRALSKSQLATLAGYSPSSSTVRNYLSFLRVGGYIVAHGARIGLSELGLSEAGDVPQPKSTQELLELWCPRVGSGPATILRTLVAVHPTAFGKDRLEEATGYSASSSTMRNYISKLRSNGLLVKGGDGYKASPTLFPGAE